MFLQTEAAKAAQSVGQQVEGVVDKIATHLAALAETLKVPAGHVYKILVNQQFYEGWSGMIIWPTFILICTICCVYAFMREIKISKEFDRDAESRSYRSYRDNKDCEVFIGAAIVSGLIGLLALIIFSFNFSYYLTQILNPEYHAIKSLVDMIK